MHQWDKKSHWWKDELERSYLFSSRNSSMYFVTMPGAIGRKNTLDSIYGWKSTSMRVVKGWNGSWDLPFFEAGKWDFVHNRKWEWDLNLSNTGWDCGIWAVIRKKKKTISWEMGLGPPLPLHDPLLKPRKSWRAPANIFWHQVKLCFHQ